MADYETFFRDYVDVFNRSIGGEVDTDAIRASYAEFFVSATAGGVVQGGANDDKYAEVLKQGAAFYKTIRLREMKLRSVDVSPIDDGHDLVRVFFTSSYDRKAAEPVSIDFDVTYMLQRRETGPKIFAFVAGDEMALYRQYRLVDADGKPT